MTPRPSIVINDYAGHPFQAQLASELADRGHEVTLLYCATNLTPHGHLDIDGDRLRVVTVSTGATFAKYDMLRRAWQEVRYGWSSAREQRKRGADVVLASNVPVLSLLVMAALNRRPRRVLWLQDIQSGLFALASGGRSGPLVRLFRALERQAIRSAHAVVAIAGSQVAQLRSLGVDTGVQVIENWAPLEQLPVRDKGNPWATANGLADKFVFLYSGTLGIKHRPELLAGLSRQFRGDPDVRVVVVSEGPGAAWLAAERGRHGLENLVLLPFQNYEDLPDVLGSADVLVAVLDQQAGSSSIPSKVLSYLCAARPLLASLPAANSASELIASRASAGLIGVEDEAFSEAALRLRSDQELRRELAVNGRLYAETTFDIERIAKQFEEVLFDSAYSAEHLVGGNT